MRVIDYAPFVLEALQEAKKPMTQTELTEAVWGSSGRNSPKLVLLLNVMVNRRQIKRYKHGNAKLYFLPTNP